MLAIKSKSNALEAGGEVLSSVEYLGIVGNENWASLPPLPLPRSPSYTPLMLNFTLLHLAS